MRSNCPLIIVQNDLNKLAEVMPLASLFDQFNSVPGHFYPNQAEMETDFSRILAQGGAIALELDKARQLASFVTCRPFQAEKRNYLIVSNLIKFRDRGGSLTHLRLGISELYPGIEFIAHSVWLAGCPGDRSLCDWYKAMGFEIDPFLQSADPQRVFVSMRISVLINQAIQRKGGEN